MDDILKVEFPLGPRTVVMTRPSDNQLFAITVIRKPTETSDPAVKFRFTERIIRFLEALAGPEQWLTVEDDMLSNVVTPSHLLTLFSDVTQFDWDAHAKSVPTEPDRAPEAPERPAPRVVSGD